MQRFSKSWKIFARAEASWERGCLWREAFISSSIAICTTPILTFALFFLNVSISRYHILLYPALCFIVPLVRNWRNIPRVLRLFVGQTLGMVTCILVVLPFVDLGGDGMATHQEAVIGLSHEWNPVRDPYFFEGFELKEQYPVLRESFWLGRGIAKGFSYVSAAIIAKGTGIHEAGKAFHLLTLMVVASGCLYVGKMAFRRWSEILVFAALVALNPVFCYQYLSYWQDGFIACTYSMMLLWALVWLLQPGKFIHFFGFLLVCVFFSGLKKSGVGYAGLTALCVFPIQFVQSSSLFSRGLLFIKGPILVFTCLAVGVITGYWNFHQRASAPIVDAVENYSSEEVVGGGETYNQVESYYDENRWIVFFKSAFSKSEPVARSTELKIPFTTSRDELRTFYYFFEDARAGGFGVFYSGFFVLAVLAFVQGFGANTRGSLLALLGILIIVAPLFFLPTYWARWIPQMWLVPLLLILPAWSSRSWRKASLRSKVFSLPSLFKVGIYKVAALAAVINIVLIIVPYTIGNAFGTWVLKQQLEIVESLDQKVLYGHGSYASNRKWLIDRGVDYEMTWDPKYWGGSYIQFYRTDTRIFMTDQDLNRSFDREQSVRERLHGLQSVVERWQPGQWLSPVLVER